VRNPWGSESFVRVRASRRFRGREYAITNQSKPQCPARVSEKARRMSRRETPREWYSVWKKRVSSGTAVLLEKLEVGASARAVKASLKIGMRSVFA
jgi:hypothetical protein